MENGELKTYLIENSYELDLERFLVRRCTDAGRYKMFKTDSLPVSVIGVRDVLSSRHPCFKKDNGKKVIANAFLQCGKKILVVYPGYVKLNPLAFSVYEPELTFDGKKYVISNSNPIPGDVLPYINDFRGICTTRNAVLENIVVDGLPFLILRIEKDINVGSEILVDYGENFWNNNSNKYEENFFQQIEANIASISLPEGLEFGYADNRISINNAIEFIGTELTGQSMVRMKKGESMDENITSGKFRFYMLRHNRVLKGVVYRKISANLNSMNIDFMRCYPDKQRYGTLMVWILKEIYANSIFCIKLQAVSQDVCNFWKKQDFSLVPGSSDKMIYRMTTSIDLTKFRLIEKVKRSQRDSRALSGSKRQASSQACSSYFSSSETSKTKKKAHSHRNPLIPSTSRKVAVRTNLDRYKQIMARLRDNTGPTYIYDLKRGDENYNTFKKLVNNNNDFKILRDVEEDLKGGITESFVSDIEFLYKLILKFYSEIEKIPEDYVQHIEYMLGELDTMKTIMLAVCSLE